MADTGMSEEEAGWSLPVDCNYDVPTPTVVAAAPSPTAAAPPNCSPHPLTAAPKSTARHTGRPAPVLNGDRTRSRYEPGAAPSVFLRGACTQR